MHTFSPYFVKVCSEICLLTKPVLHFMLSFEFQSYDGLQAYSSRLLAARFSLPILTDYTLDSTNRKHSTQITPETPLC